MSLPTIDWPARIAAHIQPDGSVTVPPRIAAWLEKKAGLNAERRIALRDADPAAYAVLAALHLAALNRDSSDCGTKIAAPQRAAQELQVWITTSEAAEYLGVTDRAIRKMIAEGKLPAQRPGGRGRWLVDRRHVNALALTP